LGFMKTSPEGRRKRHIIDICLNILHRHNFYSLSKQK
jgi:hypothetical protein